MKNLTDYITDKQTLLFEETNTIFAFSMEQFNEQKIKGITYVSCGAGMFCNKEKYTQLSEGLTKITKQGIEQDIKENGIDAIIERELDNHEAGYTWDITQTFEALVSYNVTREQVQKVFKSIDWDAKGY